MGRVLENDTVLGAIEVEEAIRRKHGDVEKTTERKKIWNSGTQE
jgi:hypothetical protein